MQKLSKVILCLYSVMLTTNATEIRFDGYRFIGGCGYVEFDISHNATAVTINGVLLNREKFAPNTVNEITLIIPGEVKSHSSFYLLDDSTCIGRKAQVANSKVRFPEWNNLYAQTYINKRAFQNLTLDNLRLKIKFEANDMHVELPEDCSELFKGSESVTEIDFSGVNPNSRVKNTKGMFEFCRNLKEINFGNFNTSNVCNMKDMFRCCESLEDLDLRDFDTWNVRDMSNMFWLLTSISESDRVKDYEIQAFERL